jgi:hypothetical protein
VTRREDTTDITGNRPNKRSSSLYQHKSKGSFCLVAVKRMFMSRMIRRTATKSPFVLRPTKLSAPPVCRLLSSSSSSHNGKQEELIPGLSGASYNSLGGEPKPFAAPTAWQAEHNVDSAQATLNSTIFELTRNQTKTIEEVVPWFFTQMPASYFKQIPENVSICLLTSKFCTPTLTTLAFLHTIYTHLLPRPSSCSFASM